MGKPVPIRVHWDEYPCYGTDWVRNAAGYAAHKHTGKTLACLVCGQRMQVQRCRVRAITLDEHGVPHEGGWLEQPQVVMREQRYILQHIHCTLPADRDEFSEFEDSDSSD